MLSYHGKGIDDMVPRMAHVTYEAPAEAMKEMLRKRHLAPMWEKGTHFLQKKKTKWLLGTFPMYL